MLALGAGADRGVFAVAAGMAVGVALLTGLAATGAPPEGRPARVLRWAARVLAAGLVAVGVLTVLAGIMDV